MFSNFLHQIRERWYFLVLRYFKYLDWQRIVRSTASHKSSLEDQAVVAIVVGNNICKDSGMCASKSWNDLPGKPTPGDEFESTTKDRHDEITSMILDLAGKPVPPPIDGIKGVLNVTQS